MVISENRVLCFFQEGGRERWFSIMFNTDTDKQWEKFGQSEPYFGVLTDEKYLAANLTDENSRIFFESGCQHVEHILAQIGRQIDPGFSPEMALDFGCGVGRVAIPLARVVKRVSAADVSGAMLKEAERNCKAAGLTNIDFYKSDDQLSLLSDKYDLVHSYIVLQHIPVDRGEQIFNRLLHLLTDRGIGVIHLTYGNSRAVWTSIKMFAKRYVPFIGGLYNLFQGRGFNEPQMQMNHYDLNRIFSMLQHAGVSDLFVEYTDHGGCLGATLYFRKAVQISSSVD